MTRKKAQAKQRNWAAMEATLRAGSARAPLYCWVVREKHLVREHFDQLTKSEQLDMLDQMCKWALSVRMGGEA